VSRHNRFIYCSDSAPKFRIHCIFSMRRDVPDNGRSESIVKQWVPWTRRKGNNAKKNRSLDALNFGHFIIAPQAHWILTPRTESILNHRSPEPGKQLQVRIAWQGAWILTRHSESLANNKSPWPCRRLTRSQRDNVPRTLPAESPGAPQLCAVEET